MGFNIKTFTNILNNMASWVSSHSPQLNNWRVGGVTRSILEAISSEIEELYFKMNTMYIQAVQQSIFTSFGFNLLPAVCSYGEITLYFTINLTDNITIPAGFQVYTAPINGVAVFFISTSDTLCLQGTNNVIMQVSCVTPGIIGNVSSYSIAMQSQPLTFIQQLNNLLPIGNGAEQETIPACKKRFASYISSLGMGTIDAIQYGCSTVTGITGVYVAESIGYLTVYAHDYLGNLPTLLQQNLITTLDSYKSAGVELIVLPVTLVPVDMSIVVYTNKQFNASDMVSYGTNLQEKVNDFFNSYVVSKSVRIAEVLGFIMNLDLGNIYNVTLSIPSDIIIPGNDLIQAGIVTLTAKN